MKTDFRDLEHAAVPTIPFLHLVTALAFTLVLPPSRAAESQAGAASPAEFTPAQPQAVRNWQDLRFGMFIHWGPVSLTGKEISWSRGDQTPIETYDRLYEQFNPTNFNAGEWVRIARAAGMKYMVLTTKHHDGFCLWDTKQTDYNIMRTPFARDVVKELAAACKQEGLAFGTYYSTCDWHHPAFPLGSPGGKTRKPNPDLDAYTTYLRAQVSELITNYGPLIEMWFDVPQETGPDRGIPTCNLVRSLQPSILINNRAADDLPADFDTPEQQIGSFNVERPWESCMTISRSGQWAWGGPQDGVKSCAACLSMLIRCAGGDGNLLLNVGPRPDGVMDPEQAARLKQIGDWLTKYGQSIYGTRGGPWKPSRSVASTRAGKTVFVHWLRRNEDTLELPKLPRKIVRCSVLTGGWIRVEQTVDQIIFRFRSPTTPAPDHGAQLLLPRLAPPSNPVPGPDQVDTIVKLELDGSAADLAPLPTTGSRKPGVKATASNFYHNQAQYGADKACDGDSDTRWATDSGGHRAWLELDFGQPKSFNCAAIEEAYAGRVRSFELQYQSKQGWKTFYRGTTLGEDFSARFATVRAQVVRLNILEATDGPTIAEFQLFKQRQ